MAFNGFMGFVYLAYMFFWLFVAMDFRRWDMTIDFIQNVLLVAFALASSLLTIVVGKLEQRVKELEDLKNVKVYKRVIE